MRLGVILTSAALAGIAAAAWAAPYADAPDPQSQKAPRSAPYEPEDDPDLVAAGRKLVVQECSSCHAIDQSMKSPRPGAPPMRTVLQRYDSDSLANDLIEGIRVGHDDMPWFDFNVIAADALIGYLKSLEKAPASKPADSNT